MSWVRTVDHLSSMSRLPLNRSTASKTKCVGVHRPTPNNLAGITPHANLVRHVRRGTRNGIPSDERASRSAPQVLHAEARRCHAVGRVATWPAGSLHRDAA